MDKEILSINNSGDVLFMMLGAVMVFAMHGGFAFLEVGTVRKKNQVNALVKLLVDFSVSTVVYFFIGYSLAYGIYFFQSLPDPDGLQRKFPLLMLYEDKLFLQKVINKKIKK